MNYFRLNLKYLREERKLSQKDLAQKIGVSKDNITSYERGSQPKFEVIEKITKFFDVDWSDLMTLNLERVDRNERQGLDPHAVLPKVVTVDSGANDNIVLVPVKAQAGYVEHLSDDEYLQEMQSFQLPGYRNGTFRAFEVEGDSMEETIMPGDIVVCEWVEEPRYLRQGYVHVLVTSTQVMVKRIQFLGNLYRTTSDNSFYPPQDVVAGDVLEAWEVKCRLTNHLPPPDNTRQRLNDLEHRLNLIEKQK